MPAIAENSRAWPAPTNETPENPKKGDGVSPDFLPIPVFSSYFSLTAKEK